MDVNETDSKRLVPNRDRCLTEGPALSLAFPASCLKSLAHVCEKKFTGEGMILIVLSKVSSKPSVSVAKNSTMPQRSGKGGFTLLTSLGRRDVSGFDAKAF